MLQLPDVAGKRRHRHGGRAGGGVEGVDNGEGPRTPQHRLYVGAPDEFNKYLINIHLINIYNSSGAPGWLILANQEDGVAGGRQA